MIGSENTKLLSCVICLPQIKEDSNKVLAPEKGTLYVVFQVHQAVKSISVVTKSTLGIAEMVSALQKPVEMTVHHANHCLTQATHKAHQSVMSWREAVSTRFCNRDYNSFSPGIWHQALCPYMIVY